MSGYDDTVVRLQREFGARLVPKQGSLFMTVINAVLKVLSFGQFKAFFEDYTTTIGKTVYTPTRWDSFSDGARTVILRHEMVHLQQAKRWGFLFSVLYLFGGLPIGAAYFRVKFEREAYVETLQAHVDLLGTFVLDDPSLKDMILRQFNGPAYLWMWPFPESNRRWYADTCARIKEAQLQKSTPVC
jgi:hypothetical protein